MNNEPIKTISLNRKAYHDYHILETVEAGLVLTGTEIKSIRGGRVSLKEAFARPEGGELWLMSCHIARYESRGYADHDPLRPRKLLLHKEQIANLIGKVSEKGLTLVPLKLYLKKGRAKVELGLGRGKKLYDKRQAMLRRDKEREIEQATKLRTRKP